MDWELSISIPKEDIIDSIKLLYSKAKLKIHNDNIY
jgi:hypothetical protein